jgi:hypothetical protein
MRHKRTEGATIMEDSFARPPLTDALCCAGNARMPQGSYASAVSKVPLCPFRRAAFATILTYGHKISFTTST